MKTRYQSNDPKKTERQRAWKGRGFLTKKQVKQAADTLNKMQAKADTFGDLSSTVMAGATAALLREAKKSLKLDIFMGIGTLPHCFDQCKNCTKREKCKMLARLKWKHCCVHYKRDLSVLPKPVPALKFRRIVNGEVL